MNWSVDIKASVVKSLAKIDRKQADRIWEFLEVELANEVMILVVELGHRKEVYRK
jgi:mRNA-degrading endonuclease RelE of RelBE toxin-antitoxin system